MSWFEKAAEQDFAPAQFFLGICYFYGKGVAENPEEAVKWFTAGAETGNGASLYYLGVCFDLGRRVKKTKLRQPGCSNFPGSVDILKD